MYHCLSCKKEFDNSLINDEDFEFVGKRGHEKILYNQKCDGCGGEIASGHSPDDTGVNVCSDGDFHPYFSPDLGIYVDSSKTLNDHLKSKGMVNLQESKEYREHAAMMREKVMQSPSMRGVT
jgi:hypothetical protein